MSKFKKWVMWASSVNPELNKNLLSVPCPDFSKLFNQPERLNELDRESDMRKSEPSE